MLAWKSLCALTLLSFSLIHCHGGAGDSSATDSRLSAVAIGDFRPNTSLNLPMWSRMQLQMNRLSPASNVIDRSYPRTEGNEIKDTQVTVPYGTYKMQLNYFDAQGKLVYESCAPDKSKEHQIQTAQYKATVVICLAGTQESVGSSVSDIEIIPVLQEEAGARPNSELKVCADSFPMGNPPTARPVNFEAEKGSPFFVRNIASLAPCLMVADRCSDSVRWVQSLSGAVGSITQNIRNASGNDSNTFLKNITTDPALNYSVGDHAACIKQQPRGVQGFLEDYAALVKTLL